MLFIQIKNHHTCSVDTKKSCCFFCVVQQEYQRRASSSCFFLKKTQFILSRFPPVIYLGERWYTSLEAQLFSIGTFSNSYFEPNLWMTITVVTFIITDYFTDLAYAFLDYYLILSATSILFAGIKSKLYRLGNSYSPKIK